VTRPADGGGRRPVAPAWFTAALAQVPERSFVDIDGVEIEVLTWGERGLPGGPGMRFVRQAAAAAGLTLR
jgi:hypothetical protein